MQLSDLVNAVKAQPINLKDINISSIEFDSRKITDGALFVALPGEKHDGHDFISKAIENGARAVVVQRKVDTSVPQIIVTDSRMAMAKLAKKFYGDFKDMIKIGITGTNGKTTTAFLMYSILSRAGYNPALIGTIYYIGREKLKAERTTPESLHIFRLLRRFYDEGCRSLVMEVSSHALSLKRVDELEFNIASFTNLSQDHLDFHKSLDEYKQAKLRIFSLLQPEGFAVYNFDDPVAVDIQNLSIANSISYGFSRRCDIQLEIEHDDLNGLDLRIKHQKTNYRVHSDLIGNYNAYNIGAAYASSIAFGIEPLVIITGIESMKSVRGRMERVIRNVFVDYAHTPDALEKALMTLNRYKTSRVILVFGCGGDRDRSKRPLMGAVAGRYADKVFITSDNPRREPPETIIEEIVRGVGRNDFTVIVNRERAIHQALKEMDTDDILLVAGKGHEEYQIIGDQIINFDDAEVIRQCSRKS
ncbi:UDP-N-acetylmuramoyl-L-alanyl-D-glutamate--2,6-diaminopimelate ligase [candidate division WOR-3 bacterium RBG_13_43_14]|uniref:UDP-N-acetylmuramoyl-L-alanyl-D-glutamate--2,6-diaminopimelate ligase n=1 Tax=candidate division WOR-3 bacterium RBG_13_43_14 TaxID=1802590 RepID=A0A1F4U8I4_UNCW3|nr:MAG: UDP-N-acetylmuramoyl-L-alanyl-D-glutamate--2,6-diaminopimelate ligase [candidate division WOR-3 bacterium RBG_13_43_14]